MSASNVTKNALSQSLRGLMATKPFDRISISDITGRAGFDRQTFYYHFNSIYDLIEWVFVNESGAALGNNKTYDTWQEGFEAIFGYVQQNSSFVLNAFHSTAHDPLERFLLSEARELVGAVVEEQSRGLDVPQTDKDFISDFYKFAFTGLLMDWIRTGMSENPHLLVERLGILIHGDIRKALEKFSRS
ncbi:MAG: TetR/AcrR family transcriptional regulator [Sphaerochaetaceae bacterium]|jgi:probable dihydroxyacetone kinase regulator